MNWGLWPHRIALRTAVWLAISVLGAAGAAAEPFAPLELAFHPKSNTVVLARGEGALRLIDFADPTKPVDRAITFTATAVAFLPDGQRFVTGGGDGMLRFWSLEGSESGTPFRASDAPIRSIAVSARGRFLATVDDRLAIRIWQANGQVFGRTLQMQRQRVDYPCTASGVAFAPDELAIAAISCTNNVYLWSLAGQPVAVPRGRDSYESCCGVRIGFSADGRYLIARRSFQPGYDAYFWSRRAGALAGGRKFPGAESVREFAPLPNTSELLILDQSGLRRLWPGGGIAGATLVPGEPANAIRAFAVSADGSRVATIEADDVVVIRDGTGAPLGRISPR